MNWLTSLFSGGVGTLVEQVGNVADKFITTGEEKQEFQLALQALVQQRDTELEETIRAELGAKERVLTAELQQGDAFTKRARPMVVYAGLLFIVYNYCVVPSAQAFSGMPAEPFTLPTEFWMGWSGIVATWSIGRTMEKRGSTSGLAQVVTGRSPVSKLLG